MAGPRKSDASPADLVKSMNVVVTDSEDDAVTEEGTWTQVAQRSATDLTYIYSETEDEYLEFTFFGTALWMRYFGLPDGGKMNISIDGGTAKVLDSYAEREQVRIAFIASNLALAEHIVKVEVDRTKATLSIGYKVAIDAFIVELSRGSQQIWSMIEESLTTSTYIIPEPLQVRSIVGTSPILPSGRIICQDDLEATTLKWRNDGGATARDTSASYVYSGAACLRITSPATAGSGNETYRQFCLLPNKRIGLELWFITPSLDDVTEIRFSINQYDGADEKSAEVKYLPDDGKFQYLNSSGGWTDIPNGSYAKWHVTAHQHLKLVADLDTGKYVYLSIGDMLIDMRTLNVYSVGSGGAPRWFVSMKITPSVDTVKSIYADDILVTNHEP